jgi:hypothetical protein
MERLERILWTDVNIRKYRRVFGNFTQMNNMVIPPELLEIKYPWCLCSHDKRIESVQDLKVYQKTLSNAIQSLERSLIFLEMVDEPTVDSIPKEIIDYWNFFSESVAESITDLSRFDSKIVKSQIEKEIFGTDITDILVHEAEQFWLWRVVLGIAYDSSKWLYESLKNNNKNSEEIKYFLELVSSHWEKVDYTLACHLISCIVFKELSSLSLLKEIEKKSQNQSVINTAASYREWIESKMATNA